jgi:1-acyl-sn-glycerol-3-phosphate acyltransferase
MLQRWQHELHAVEVRGLEHLRSALQFGQGVLITPNHFTYADPFLLSTASDQLGCPFFFMTAWQVFATSGWLKRLVLRQHGCFSVDRDGADLRAFRQAVTILQGRPHPLVIFPEGEMYHVGERIMPFHEGPAAMALAAAKKGTRPVLCLPCALKYYYLEDPMAALLRLMDRLEEALFWRPAPQLPLEQRIYRLAEGALALKEVEYLGSTAAGALPQRLGSLADHVLRGMEDRYGVPRREKPPHRVKALRQAALQKLEGLRDSDCDRQQLLRDLDDLFFVVQLFSYPGDYVAERPTIERMAETLDKFEEDILGVPIAKPRGKRAAIVVFGEAVPVQPGAHTNEAAAALTHILEQRVQSLLDGIVVPKPKNVPMC